jgi:Na+-driven multidrug efflux pump
VAFAVIFAPSGAIGQVIGRNSGAGRMDRVRRTYRDGLLFCAVFTGAMTVLLFALCGPLVALFAAEEAMRDLLVLFCGPLALAFFFDGVIFVEIAAFKTWAIRSARPGSTGSGTCSGPFPWCWRGTRCSGRWAS